MAEIFRYRALDKENNSREGLVEAPDKREAVEKIKRMGLRPVEVEKRGNGFSLKGILHRLDAIELTPEKVDLKEMYLFCRQFSSLLRSGIPIINSLKLLSGRVKNEALQDALTESASDIEEGRSLSDAFRKHPVVFSDYFIHLVESGEAGGFLDQTLINLAQHYKNHYKKKQQVASSLRYPLITLFAAVVIVILLMVKVIPSFAAAFSNLDIELPLPTRVLLIASGFLSANWVWLLLGIIIVIIGLYRFYKTGRGKYLFHLLLLKIPVVKGFVRENSLITFAENLSLLEKSGVDFLQSMKIVNNNIGNLVLKERLKEARELINDGINISSALGRQAIFPDIALQMIRVGEETGELATKLDNIVDFYREEVEEKFERLVSLIEPVMIVFLTLLIGGIVASVILPIFRMSQNIR